MLERPDQIAAIDEHSVVRPSATTGTIEVDRDAVVVDEPSGRAHALNATGSIVWRCLDGSGPLRSVIDDLADAYAQPRPRIAADVVELVRHFARLGLIDGLARDATALPPEIAHAAAGECAPDDDPAVVPSFDSRYLAAPPNG
jgi:hypothetical protein